MKSATLGGDNFFPSSDFTSASGRNPVRPVVSLGSNIKISTDGGTADSPRALSK